MPLERDLIERVVADVLQQLQHTADGAQTAEVDGGPVRGDRSGPEIVLADAVVTAELLLERSGAARNVVIGKKAILTPSAQDVIRARNLVVRRQSEPAVSGSGARWLAGLVSGTAAAKQAVDEQVRTGAGRWSRELLGTAAEAAAFATRSLCTAEADGVIVLSRNAAEIACRANRNAKVRGAVVRSARDLPALREQFGPNLLCVDPDGESFFSLRNLLRAIAAAGPPQPPAGWDQA